MTPKIDNVLSAGACVFGNLTFSGGLWVDADVEGALKSSGDEQSLLVIGEAAHVTGDIEADEVVVYGHVNGCIRTRKISICKTATVGGGRILCAKATIEDGATITSELRKGNIVMGTRTA